MVCLAVTSPACLPVPYSSRRGWMQSSLCSVWRMSLPSTPSTTTTPRWHTTATLPRCRSSWWARRVSTHCHTSIPTHQGKTVLGCTYPHLYSCLFSYIWSFRAIVCSSFVFLRVLCLLMNVIAHPHLHVWKVVSSPYPPPFLCLFSSHVKGKTVCFVCVFITNTTSTLAHPCSSLLHSYPLRICMSVQINYCNLILIPIREEMFKMYTSYVKYVNSYECGNKTALTEWTS